MTTDQTPDRVTAIYDAIDAFQRTHRTGGGLQHAQIRALLAEHLDRELPVAAPSASADRSGLRERIAALFRHPPGVERLGDATPGEIADAVLSVLPPDGRAGVLLWAADQVGGYRGALNGKEWPEFAADLLRRLAVGERDEQQAQQDGPETVVDVYRLALRYADALTGSSHADARTWSYALRWFSQLVRGGGLARYARDSFGIKFGIEVPAPTPVAASTVRANENGGTVAETLAAALDGLHTLIATSSRDWGTYRVDAWLWAVLVGWDCEEAHGHNESCEDGAAMRELADRHGWDEATVAKARRYRAAVRTLTGPAAAPVAGQPLPRP